MLRNQSSVTVCFSVLIVLLCAGVATAQPTERSFVVEQGTLVKGCGGITGGCRDFRIRGELSLTYDTAAATASISADALEIADPDGNFVRFALPAERVVGTISDGAIRFASTPDVYPFLDWSMTFTTGGLLLQGVYGEGCCDLYDFEFRNVSFDGAPVLAPTTMLYLDDERFGVEVRYETFDGATGDGKAIEQGSDSGYFWFFDANNTEVVVKLIDGCASFDRFWFFAAGLTNVEVEITVTDFLTGAQRTYRNPMGRTFETILDIDAFDTCG